MTWRGSASRRAMSRRGTLWTLLAVVGLRPVLAQTVPELDAGIACGPVLVSPSLRASVGYDTNLFLLDSAGHPPPEPQAVNTLEPTVRLVVPFRNSVFRLSDTYRLVHYEKTTDLNGESANVISAELDLRFSTADTLELSANQTNGVAETLTFDPGGEALFRGQAYLYQQESVRLGREDVGQRGYRISITRNALNFKPDQLITFFDYTGYDAEAAALIPVSQSANLSLGYLGARYDQFDLGAPDPNAVFRREAGDTLYAGLEGRLGPKNPYHLRIGWENLDFSLGPPTGTDFHGIVGDAALALVGAGGFLITATAVRQPYPSFLLPNNYYLFSAVLLDVRKQSLGASSVGGRLELARGAYPDAVPYTPPGQPPIEIHRRDETVQAEAYANLAVREHVLFRISLRQAVRSSNYPGADYHETVLSGGFVFGWL